MVKALRNTKWASLPKIENAAGSEPCGEGICQVCDHIITTKNFTTKACGEVFIIQSGPLTVTEKTFFNFWEENFVMILPMLEKLKETFVFGLIIIKVNTDLIRKENNVPQKGFHSRYIQIAIEVLMIGK